MGLMLDTSLLIADERGAFDMAEFLRKHATETPVIAMITASELLHGVERARDNARRAKRSTYLEATLSRLPAIPFDIAQARIHARIWAELAAAGTLIGPHDIQIAATAASTGTPLATLNVEEFARVRGLTVVDARPFTR